MITKIGFKNIRIFEDLTEFELKPLTILTGANNSGKSAMQKMLLLLSTGFKTKNNQIQLDILDFKKEFINKTGDFRSNVNYNNQDNQICFTFQFEDEIFGILNATLVYKGDDSGITGTLIKLSIEDNNEILFALEKVKPNKDDLTMNDWVWKWDLNNLPNYFEKLRYLLLKLRREGELNIDIHNIAVKLEENNSLDYLSLEEKQTYNDFKENGIIAYDPRAIKIQKDNLEYLQNSGEPPTNNPIHNIFDENTGDIYMPRKIAEKISNEFPPFMKGSEFLIYTDLLKKIGKNYDYFLSKTDEESAELREELINRGIKSSENFNKSYKEFEIICLIELFKYNFTETVDFDEHGTPSSLSIHEIISIKNNYTINYTNNFSKEQYESNKILSILKDFFPNERRPVTISPDILNQIFGKNSIKDSFQSKEEKKLEEKKNLFEDCLSTANKYYFKQFNPFTKGLQEMLNRTMILSYDSKIKKQYLYGDYDIQDSLFLEFGVEYFKNDYNITEKIKFINKWLEEFEIAEELKVSKIKLDNNIQSQYLGFYYSLIINKQEVPLYDCGSGIHQIILLLLNIVSAGYRKTLLLEEPETNMHPNLQSKLAELFIEAHKKFRTDFIIETHSEYLIKKLQYLTAKKEISNEEVIIYYFNKEIDVDQNNSKINRISINKNGGLTDSFGPGFFDESTRLEFDLIKFNENQMN